MRILPYLNHVRLVKHIAEPLLVNKARMLTLT
jgi:hypothetical protein